MLDVVLIGINHRSAPVELRECLAFNEDDTFKTLVFFKNSQVIKETILFSTCNRVEMLMTTSDPGKAIHEAKEYISDFKQMVLRQFEDSLYIYQGSNAVRHIFKVASSLDSLIVGEPQILGQIKEAYRRALAQKTSGVILNRLLHKAFFVAKRVRHETGIGDHAVSISYAAIELAKKIFGSIENKTVLLIGAGEMAELAVEHLIRNRAGSIFVANRTFERALKLSRNFNGKAIKFEEIDSTLEFADIIISSTGASGFVILQEQVKKLLRKRKNKPLFFIDIAVPRDIDPGINRLNNAYVYDIDDLKGVIEENIEDRKREAVKAQRIIDEAVIKFQQWHNNLDIVPTIIDLRKKMETIAQNEIKKTFKSLQHLSGADYQAIYRMTNAIINKTMHDPTLFLKQNGYHGTNSASVDFARKLFNLDEE
ncbi:MAG: glutamyl-tRNA reductase [Desulfobacterales bacterium]